MSLNWHKIVTMKKDSAQIASVRKAGLTIYESWWWTPDAEKCPLSLLTGENGN